VANEVGVSAGKYEVYDSHGRTPSTTGRRSGMRALRGLLTHLVVGRHSLSEELSSCR
jgi:hypothetical protein